MYTDSRKLNEVLNGVVSIDEYAQFEQKMSCEFHSEPQSNHFPTYKESKDHYNYLYLDPRVLCRMGTYVGDPEQELFNFYMFVRSVFYIGEGKGGRAMAHLQETRKEVKKIL